MFQKFWAYLSPKNTLKEIKQEEDTMPQVQFPPADPEEQFVYLSQIYGNFYPFKFTSDGTPMGWTCNAMSCWINYTTREYKMLSMGRPEDEHIKIEGKVPEGIDIEDETFYYMRLPHFYLKPQQETKIDV